MPHALNRVLPSQMPVGDQGIARIILIRPRKRSASCYRNTVFKTGSLFCTKQIIIFPDLVKMRTLYPVGFLHGTVIKGIGRPCKLTPLKIKLLQPDLAVSKPLCRLLLALSHIVALLPFKIKGRINPSIFSLGSLQIDGI